MLAKNQHSVPALIAEVDRLTGQLGECRHVLNTIATAPTPDDAHLAAELLRKQKAPGWERSCSVCDGSGFLGDMVCPECYHRSKAEKALTP